MESVYTLQLGDLTRQLPLTKISSTTAVASLVLLGDQELTSTAAKMLAAKVPTKTDIILTAESKGIPLAHEISQLLGLKQYCVARKQLKHYMKHPIVEPVKSITTDEQQYLILDDDDVLHLFGKQIFLLDDVVSTGETMLALTHLVNRVGGEVSGSGAILAEGEAALNPALSYLQTVPLFKATDVTV